MLYLFHTMCKPREDIYFWETEFIQLIKNAKNMRKTILQEHQSCSIQKTARKSTQYSRNEPNLKIGHLAKLQPFAKWSVWLKIKNAKNVQKTILQEHQSCSVQKTARKSTRYSRNETISKICHLAKATALCKMVSLAQKLKMPKTKKTLVQEHQQYIVQEHQS